MATAQNIIDSARYDLDDYQTGIMWDNTELLNYLNRMVVLMNNELASLDSELVEGEETDIDCVADQSYVDLSSLNSGLWSNVKSVWIGQDLIEQISLTNMRYKRIFRSGTAQPVYWTVRNEELLFQQDCTSSYTTLILYYNKKQAELALTDNMPYQDRFNESFREMLVLYAQAKKDGNQNSVNGMMSQLFQKRAMEETIRRGFVQKSYYIDF